MDRDTPDAPAFWPTDLAFSESEVARGERVPALEIHAELLAALSELDAERVDDAGGPVQDVREH